MFALILVFWILTPCGLVDMETFWAGLFMYTFMGAVMCAPLPDNESSSSLGEEVFPILERVFHRSPRQVDPNRQQVIDNIFKVPIATLSAISSLLQSTRPITQRPLFPININNQVQTPAPVSVFAGHGGFHGRRTVGARVAQVSPAADGSSFKI